MSASPARRAASLGTGDPSEEESHDEREGIALMILDARLEEPERRRRVRSPRRRASFIVRYAPGPAQPPLNANTHGDDLSDLDADVEEEQRGRRGTCMSFKTFAKPKPCHPKPNRNSPAIAFEPREEYDSRGPTYAMLSAMPVSTSGRATSRRRAWRGKGSRCGPTVNVTILYDKRAPTRRETQLERDVIVAQAKDVQ